MATIVGRVKRGFLIILILMLSACQKVVVKPSFTVDNFPRIDGSTVTLPISETVFAELTNITIAEARPYIWHSKTHEAYLNLIMKVKDLIFVTSPSEEELALAEKQSIEFEIVPIVAEAFVFIIHKDNPITNLTLSQIQQIYTGELTNWKQVGGQDVPIRAFQRPSNSGSQTGFLELVMKNKAPVSAPTEMLVQDMGGLIEAIAAYREIPDAIGYTYFYYLNELWKNANVKLLGVDGVIPTPTTITNKTYPIHTAYYAVFRKDEPKNSPVRKIVAYLLTKEGQNLLEKAGYVKVK